MAILRVRDKDGNITEIPALEGLSAYEVAVKNGFKGTEEEWLESLRIPPDLTGFATEDYVAQTIQEALGGIENGTYWKIN
jgi:hypothetical protein